MRFPGFVSSRVSRRLQDQQQLRPFVREVEPLRVRDLEALGNAETDGLLLKPIHSDPFAERADEQVALVREIVEAKRTTARQIEVVKHLIDFHGAPPARRLGSQALDTLSILVQLLFREEETPIQRLEPQN